MAYAASSSDHCCLCVLSGSDHYRSCFYCWDDQFGTCVLLNLQSWPPALLITLLTNDDDMLCCVGWTGRLDYAAQAGWSQVIAGGGSNR